MNEEAVSAFATIVETMDAKNAEDRSLILMFEQNIDALLRHWVSCWVYTKGDPEGVGYTFHKGFRQYDVLSSGESDMVIWNALRGQSCFWPAYTRAFQGRTS